MFTRRDFLHVLAAGTFSAGGVLLVGCVSGAASGSGAAWPVQASGRPTFYYFGDPS